MVAIIGEAAVALRPEAGRFASQAESEIDGSMPGIAKKAAGYFAVAFAAVGIGSFLKGAVSAASDVGESVSKVNVVFGESSQRVLDFAANASSAFGQSRGQALEAAGTFGNLLRSLGLTADESANMSTSMVGLASDLASFNNTDPAEALDALRAGLTGETEPLKRYGINLNDATLKTEALRLGLDTSGSTLSAVTKAQAAYSLIMQQSSLAQGDFARTSAGLANQQRIMGAQFTDLQANIGGLFVPILGIASGAITGGLMPALLNLTAGLPAMGQTVGSFFDYWKAGVEGSDTAGLIQAQSQIGERFQMLALDAGNARAVFSEAFADGRAGAQLLADDSLGGLAARVGVVAAGVRSDLGGAFASIQTAVAPAFASLSAAAGPALASIKANVGALFAGLGEGGGGLAGFGAMIGNGLAAAVPVISGVLNSIMGVITPMLPQIGAVFAQLVPVVQQIFGQIGPIISQLIPVITAVAGIWREVFLGAFQALLPILPTLVGALGQIVSTLLSGLGPVIAQLAPVIQQLATAFSGALVGAIQALVPVLPVLATAFGQIAGTIAELLVGALNAILPILPTLIDLFGQVAGMLAGAFSSVLQALIPILPPIVEALAQIAQVLVGVLMAALQAILPLIPMLVGLFVMLVQAALIPLLPILPLLANLLATIIGALAPIIPVVIQVAALIIQLAIAALIPLMPLISLAANLFAMLISAIVPIIQILVGVVGGFISMAATIISVVVGFIGTIVSVWMSLATAIFSIFSTIFGFISGIWNSIFGFISGAVSRIVNAVSSGFNAAIGFFASLPGKVLGFLGGLGSSLYNIGRDMIQGLINGAGSLLRSIGNFFLDMVPGWIKGPLKAALGISSPSRVFYGYGQEIGHGLILGMESMRPAIAAAASSLAEVPMVTAARELLGHISSGGSYFEDMSFRGMSSLLSDFNDQLADVFTASGAADTRAGITGFLSNFIASGGGAAGRAAVAESSDAYRPNVIQNIYASDQMDTRELASVVSRDTVWAIGSGSRTVAVTTP